MNFFFDANMSRRYARMIHELCEGSHQIVHITEYEDFLHNNLPTGGNNTKDVEWLRKLGESEKDWKIISGDSKILDVAHERAALRKSRLTFFSMDTIWAKQNFYDQAWKLVKVWKDIIRCANTPEPKLYRIHMGKNPYINEI